MLPLTHFVLFRQGRLAGGESRGIDVGNIRDPLHGVDARERHEGSAPRKNGGNAGTEASIRGRRQWMFS
jgi:hypothetical protein